MKKNRIKQVFWAIALVIYAASAVHAQVVKNPETPFNPIPIGADSNIRHIVVSKFKVKGNNSNNIADALHLQVVPIELPTSLVDKAKIVVVNFFYVAYNDTIRASADVNQHGSAIVNLDVVLTPKFHDVYITVELDPKNLNLGDTFEVKVSLGIALAGVTPNEYLEVDPQFLFYGKKEIATTGIHSLEEPVVSIYPNPFVNLINVDLPKNEDIVIINKLGQQVYTGSSNDPIETANFPSGEYFIQTSYGFKKVIK